MDHVNRGNHVRPAGSRQIARDHELRELERVRQFVARGPYRRHDGRARRASSTPA